MKILIIIAACAAYVAASDSYSYNGRYDGKCETDGLSYRDTKSFVVCSNGNSYVQACAPGSRNSGYEKYSSGNKYSYSDFCDINLVDDGYTVKGYKAEPAYHPRPAYTAEPTYEPKTPSYEPAEEYKPEPSYEKESYGSGYSYNGEYEGKCGNDGLYYRDDKSFVFCSNGNSYVQACAPGSRNSGNENYSSGNKYSYSDFCDINLVDDGYTVKGYKAEPAYHPRPAYTAEPTYEPEQPSYEPAEEEYKPEPSYEKKSYGSGYSYNGEYEGKCGNDGLYYRDDKSFVFCSNGNSYVQACAPGSRNSGQEQYSSGNEYSYSDFCDINLVDEGYGVKHGYEPKKASYEPKKPSYEPVKEYYEPKKPSYEPVKEYYEPNETSYKCSKEGFHYRDETSFTVCSNGNSYVQKCAPGSRNSGYEKYSDKYNDFCDVNLVDDGYTVKGYHQGH